jgi:hypothetical protein
MAFIIDNLSDQQKTIMLRHNIWAPECPVPIESLRRLGVIHYDFNSAIKSGSIITIDIVAQNLLNIFQELFAQKFPIFSILPIESFLGDDELSMAANNSSCFNFRRIMGSDRLSMHSYGLAIDINPLQNPYIVTNEDGTRSIYPEASEKYLDRSIILPGMVEPIVDIFAKYGFNIWGGDWRNPIDYQHFQTDRALINNIGLSA